MLQDFHQRNGVKTTIMKIGIVLATLLLALVSVGAGAKRKDCYTCECDCGNKDLVKPRYWQHAHDCRKTSHPDTDLLLLVLQNARGFCSCSQVQLGMYITADARGIISV